MEGAAAADDVAASDDDYHHAVFDVTLLQLMLFPTVVFDLMTAMATTLAMITTTVLMFRTAERQQNPNHGA